MASLKPPTSFDPASFEALVGSGPASRKPPACFGPASPSATTLTPTERVLKESLTTPEFRDVHLYAFTRRIILPDGSSKIDHPLPVLAVGSILKDTEYFSKLLTSGFAESSAGLASEIRQNALEDEYDYESDSDLDEFEMVGGTPNLPESSSGSPHPSNTPAPSLDGRLKGRETTIGSGETNGGTSLSFSGQRSPQHILLPSVAYRTLRAYIFYLYTNKVNFLPLRSGGTAGRQLALLTADRVAPPCSPKSMYRLAEIVSPHYRSAISRLLVTHTNPQYGMTKLQGLAYDAIVARLTLTNVVEEAFSRFFARYDRLREHTVSVLSQNFSDSKVQRALPDALDKVLLGMAPHAGPLLHSLLGVRMASVPVPAPPSPVPVADLGRDGPESGGAAAEPAVPAGVKKGKKTRPA
ncbi:hypothetical protein C8Q79DRAFT_567910 [Trametes meyenii]|nr:hypothetical protein C8Q79DRAFT_567910 [Trametes meyenii]